MPAQIAKFRAPMPHLFIRFQSGPPEVTVDAMIAGIKRQIPGTKITTDDWYHDRHANEEHIIQQLQAKGREMRHAREILDSIDRAGRSYGATKGISVPMGDKVELEGRICSRFALLHADTAINEKIVNQLLSIFRSFKIVKDFQVSQIATRRK